MNAPDLSQAVWRKSSRSNGQANCVEVAFVPWRKSSFSNVQANCVEVAFTPWRKSSRSNGNVACVEVALGSEAVAVRDSKNTDGPVLAVPVAGWAAFLHTWR